LEGWESEERGLSPENRSGGKAVAEGEFVFKGGRMPKKGKRLIRRKLRKPLKKRAHGLTAPVLEKSLINAESLGVKEP